MSCQQEAWPLLEGYCEQYDMRYWKTIVSSMTTETQAPVIEEQSATASQTECEQGTHVSKKSLAM